MNTNLLSIVKQIIASHGEGILGDPQRLKPIFKNHAKNLAKEERVAFGRCIEQGFYGKIKMAKTAEDRRRLKAGLARQLQSTAGINPALAADMLDILNAALPLPASSSAPGALTPPSSQPYRKPRPPITQTRYFKAALIAVPLMVVVIAIGIFLSSRPWSLEKTYEVYKNSVVMIYGAYNYEVRVDNRVIGNYIVDDNGRLVEDDVYEYSGTGFLVSQDGLVVTNQHVAVPWNDREIDSLTSLIQRRYDGDVRITGQFEYIGFILNNTQPDIPEDLIECSPQSIRTINPDIDVAVMQTTTKTLPRGVTHIVDVREAAIDDKAHTVGITIYTIGFPAGFEIGATEQGITSTAQEGKITQERGNVEFQLSAASEHGSSGSPVFNQYGQLLGVIWGGYENRQGYNFAIKAKFVRNLFQIENN
jgi:S1-C subfamily serine protease